MKALVLCICLAVFACTGSSSQSTFEAFTDKFVSGYRALNIPDLELSYVTNLNQMPGAADIEKQTAFFKQAIAGLAAYKGRHLTLQQQTDYDLIEYESNLTIEKLALAKQWAAGKPAAIPATGLYTIPYGKEWYAWFLKKWVAANVTPDEIYQFGLKEVERVKKHIEDIRTQVGMDEDKFYERLNDSSFF